MKILEEIQNAETRSDKRLELARKKKDELIAKANKDALQLVSETQAAFEQSRKEKIAEKEAELAKTRKEIEKTAAKNLEKLEKKFSANKEKAIEALLKKFEERVNA